MTKGKDSAKSKETNRDNSNKQNPSPRRVRVIAPSGGWINAGLILAGLAVLVALCYLPLLDYFFSQDDFGLMYNSRYEPARAIEASFGSSATYFRPLTRFAYFAVAYRVFGMRPVPYHVVSLVLHLCTSLLLYVLLRRLRLSAAPAVVATGLFALSVAFFHVVGWISCVQQAAAALFFLLAIVLAVDALRECSGKKRIMSVVAYLLALLSIEQIFVAPALVFLIAVLGLTGRRFSVRATIKFLWPHLLLAGVYLAVRFFWKGLPHGGTLRFVSETNVLENLAVYFGAMYDFWPDVSNLIPNHPVKLVPSHVIFGGLVVYHLARRRLSSVIFGLVFVLFTLLPLLFLQGHYFYYHTYVPAFGAIYLFGLALEDLFTLLARLRIHTRRRQLLVSAMAILVIATFSFQKVRENEKRAVDRKVWKQASFVLRRAQMAEAAYHDLKAKAGDMTGISEVHMVYLPPGRKKGIVTRDRDLYWALGAGAAVNLFFTESDFEVIIERSTLGMRGWETEQSRVFFYDDNGNCFTYREIMGGGVK